MQGHGRGHALSSTGHWCLPSCLCGPCTAPGTCGVWHQEPQEEGRCGPGSHSFPLGVAGRWGEWLRAPVSGGHLALVTVGHGFTSLYRNFLRSGNGDSKTDALGLGLRIQSRTLGRMPVAESVRGELPTGGAAVAPWHHAGACSLKSSTCSGSLQNRLSDLRMHLGEHRSGGRPKGSVARTARSRP